jgi:hypothetical protein
MFKFYVPNGKLCGLQYCTVCKVVIIGWKVKCDNTQYVFVCCLTVVVRRTGILNRRYFKIRLIDDGL